MHMAEISEAAACLAQGGLVAYPTETFFAVGCLAADDQALARVFQVKKRLLAMPLPIIVADQTQVLDLIRLPAYLEADLQRLQAEFWPGPLTLILPAQARLSPLLTGGTGKVALRISPHPVAAELARQAGQGIVSSSANLSGQAPAVSVDDLCPELLAGVDYVLNLEPKPCGGLPSTIVEPKGELRLKLLRQGAVSKEQLTAQGFILE